MLTMPHGVVFSSGFIARIDGKDVGKFEPLTSDALGAYAKMPLTADTASALEKGQKLNVVFDGTNGQKFNVAMALSGFGTARQDEERELIWPDA